MATTETFTFAKVPTSVAELKALPECDLQSPFKTAALAMLVLMNYGNDVDETINMTDVLRGPDPTSPFGKQFYRDRLVGKEYVPASFFAGATVENGYTPSTPLTITVSDNPYSYPEENWATLYVQSSGADSPRPIKMRKKPSTGEWFLNDNQALAGIRIPAAADPWA